MKIPVCSSTLTGNEWKYVKECLDSNWISSKGRFVSEFEQKFADYIQIKYGVSTTNGTSAIHLALESLRIGKGEEVIVPSFTMVGSVFPIIYCGAKPVLVDSELETWNINVSRIEEKITPKAKAILAVHTYGHPCDMKTIMEIAEDHDLYVIEDAAEAHGAEYKGKKAGSFGDVGCFSFYANKIITTGEGGMMVTNNKKIYERAQSLKNMAHAEKTRFLHYSLGFNYRMTNLQAAVGLAQLDKIDEFVEARRRNAKLYNEMLAGVDGLVLPPEKNWAKNVYWMYTVLIEEDKFGESRDVFMEKLAKDGIETRPSFVPMNKQPFLKKMGLFRNETYPIAKKLGQQGVNLPSSSSLTEEEITLVCESIREIQNR